MAYPTPVFRTFAERKAEKERQLALSSGSSSSSAGILPSDRWAIKNPASPAPTSVSSPTQRPHPTITRSATVPIPFPSSFSSSSTPPPSFTQPQPPLPLNPLQHSTNGTNININMILPPPGIPLDPSIAFGGGAQGAKGRKPLPMPGRGRIPQSLPQPQAQTQTQNQSSSSSSVGAPSNGFQNTMNTPPYISPSIIPTISSLPSHPSHPPCISIHSSPSVIPSQPSHPSPHSQPIIPSQHQPPIPPPRTRPPSIHQPSLITSNQPNSTRSPTPITQRTSSSVSISDFRPSPLSNGMGTGSISQSHSSTSNIVSNSLGGRKPLPKPPGVNGLGHVRSLDRGSIGGFRKEKEGEGVSIGALDGAGDRERDGIAEEVATKARDSIVNEHEVQGQGQGMKQTITTLPEPFTINPTIPITTPSISIHPSSEPIDPSPTFRMQVTSVITPVTSVTPAPPPPPAGIPVVNIPTFSFPDDHNDEVFEDTVSTIPSISFSVDPDPGANLTSTPIQPGPSTPTIPTTPQPNPQSKPKHTGPGIFCPGCDTVIIGRVLKAINEAWHPECFRCSTCRMSLEHVSSYEHEGRPHCHMDYHDAFAPKCHHCQTPIVDARFVTIDDPNLGLRHYHELHFFCGECGDPFLDPSKSSAAGTEHTRSKSKSLQGQEQEEGEEEDETKDFIIHGKHAFCVECDIKLHKPKCSGCKKPIRGDAIEAMNAKWHKECFRCAVCGEEFAHGCFFPDKRKALCQDCFCA